MTTICGMCQARPTKDDASFCATCGDGLASDLRDLRDWLADELETSATGEGSTRYDGNGGGKGGTKDTDLRVGWPALEARREVRRALARAVIFCMHHDVRNSSPHDHDPELPTGETALIAEWMLWRVDGMAMVPTGDRHASAIVAATFRARRVIDCPPARQWLGSCLTCGRGRLVAVEGKPLAICDLCRASYEADEVRAWLLDQLDEKLMTAAEIAKASTYLGLRDDRERVRKRLNTWATRGQITPEPSITTEVVYRFGPIWRLLMEQDAKKDRLMY